MTSLTTSREKIARHPGESDGAARTAKATTPAATRRIPSQRQVTSSKSAPVTRIHRPYTAVFSAPWYGTVSTGTPATAAAQKNSGAVPT